MFPPERPLGEYFSESKIGRNISDVVKIEGLAYPIRKKQGRAR